MKKFDIGEMVRRCAIIRRDLNRGLIGRRDYNDELLYITWRYFYGK